jgi:Domain of unknown function (DUF4350)
MSEKLSSEDRKLLLIAAAAFVVLVVVGFLLAPTSTGAEVASSYSTASGGAKAAYLLLQESGYQVERWQRPESELRAEKNTVLIIADAETIPEAKQKSAVEQFISGGGRVIATGIVGARFLPQDSSESNPMPAKPASEFKAITPAAITRAAPKIRLAPIAFWGSNSGIPLYGDAQNTVATRLTQGDGDAIWLASPAPLTNSGLKNSSNLEFFLAAIGEKPQTRVLFDEYVHGYGRGHERPGQGHPLMAALLAQAVVLALGGLWTYSRRSGPLRPLAPETRSSPLEFVETLAELYQQAHATSIAVDVYHQRLQFWLSRRLGVAKDAPIEEIARAVCERWHMDDDGFAETLRRAASARYDPGLPQKQAFEIVKALHAYAVKLKLFPAAKEKP